jgi:hypothetical protein
LAPSFNYFHSSPLFLILRSECSQVPSLWPGKALGLFLGIMDLCGTINRCHH